MVGSLFCKGRELGWASGRGEDGGFEKGLRRTKGQQKVSKLDPPARRSAEEEELLCRSEEQGDDMAIWETHHQQDSQIIIIYSSRNTSKTSGQTIN